jgi:probable phosphoglycerate mutase
MTKIILTRHGHVAGIAPERFRGRTELPLTELGVRQAQAVARRIAEAWRPAAIYTSPLGRCVATGRAIGEASGAVCRALEGLNDIDYGLWRDKSHDEVRAAWPALYAAWREAPHLMRIPDGDSLQDLAARVGDAIRFVLERHPDDPVALVGHESVNRVLLLLLLDLPLSAYWRLAQAPCAINEVDIVGRQMRIVRINDTGHLPSDRQSDS